MWSSRTVTPHFSKVKCDYSDFEIAEKSNVLMYILCFILKILGCTRSLNCIRYHHIKLSDCDGIETTDIYTIQQEQTTRTNTFTVFSAFFFVIPRNDEDL